MPLYARKYAICEFLQNMRNMLRSHDRYKPHQIRFPLELRSTERIAYLVTTNDPGDAGNSYTKTHPQLFDVSLLKKPQLSA